MKGVSVGLTITLVMLTTLFLNRIAWSEYYSNDSYIHNVFNLLKGLSRSNNFIYDCRIIRIYLNVHINYSKNIELTKFDISIYLYWIFY